MAVIDVNCWDIPPFHDISFYRHNCPVACPIATSADASSADSGMTAVHLPVLAPAVG
jgi:hypothetical protein